MNKIIKSFIIFLFIFIIVLGIIIFIIDNFSNNNETDSSIEFFSIVTSYGFNDTTKNTKYKITNTEELEMFQTLYNGFKLSKEYDLSKNTIFIQTQVYGSGSVELKFKNVKLNRKLKFETETYNPGFGTMDMAYWYLIAVIPNNKLKFVNTNEWKNPIDIENSFKKEYTIAVEGYNLNLNYSLDIIEENVNSIGKIILQQYHYSSKSNKETYTLITYDEEISKKIINNINSTESKLKARLISEQYKDEAEYKNFKNELKKSITPYYQINLWSSTNNQYSSWRNYN